MKKNNTMRIAAGLAVAALLSTCLVSGTYAKYTTSGSSNDTAQVAKWGVTVANDGGNAFDNKYAKDDTTVTDITGDSVKATTGASYDLVAPGTKGEFKAATVTGTPEVAVHVENAATITLVGWDIPTGAGDTTEFYCPLKFTVNGTAVNTDSCTSAADVKAAVENAVKATSKNYEANTALSANYSAKIEWEWAFSTSQDNDVKDTKLGDLAAAPTVSIAVTTTVTQID